MPSTGCVPAQEYKTARGKPERLATKSKEGWKQPRRPKSLGEVTPASEVETKNNYHLPAHETVMKSNTDECPGTSQETVLDSHSAHTLKVAGRGTNQERGIPALKLTRSVGKPKEERIALKVTVSYSKPVHGLSSPASQTVSGSLREKEMEDTAVRMLKDPIKLVSSYLVGWKEDRCSS